MDLTPHPVFSRTFIVRINKLLLKIVAWSYVHVKMCSIVSNDKCFSNIINMRLGLFKLFTSNLPGAKFEFYACRLFFKDYWLACSLSLAKSLYSVHCWPIISQEVPSGPKWFLLFLPCSTPYGLHWHCSCHLLFNFTQNIKLLQAGLRYVLCIIFSWFLFVQYWYSFNNVRIIALASHPIFHVKYNNTHAYNLLLGYTRICITLYYDVIRTI